MTARDRRALIAGAVLIGGIMIAFRGAPAARRGYAGLRDRTAERLSTLERARETVASGSGLRDSLAILGARVVALAPKVVAVGSAAEAAAELSLLLTSLAGREQLRVTRLEALPDSAAGRLAEAAVRLELEGDLPGVAAFLGRLEHGDPLLDVRFWSIQASDVATAEVERLRVEFVVTGRYVPKERG